MRRTDADLIAAYHKLSAELEDAREQKSIAGEAISRTRKGRRDFYDKRSAYVSSKSWVALMRKSLKLTKAELDRRGIEY